MAGIPNRVAEAARALSLGEPRGAYWRPDNVVFAFLWAFLTWVLAAAAAGGLGTAGGNSGGSGWPAGVSVALGVILAVAAAGSAWRVVGTLRHRRLYLYHGGAVATNAAGRVRRAANWSDTRVYYHTVRQGMTWRRYRLVFDGGGMVRFGVPGAPQGKRLTDGIGPQLLGVSAEAKLPAAAERFRAGEAVPFGPLTVDAAGIAYKAQTLPWSQVQAVGVVALGVYGMQHLQIAIRDGKRVLVDIAKIPDLSVLLALTDAATSPASS